MGKHGILWLGLASCGILAGPALAGGPNNATEEMTESASTEVVCRSAPAPTGSRIGARRICHTQAEWDAIDEETRMMMGNANRSNSFVNGGRPEVGISPVTGEPAN